MSLNDLIKKRLENAIKELESKGFKEQVGKTVTESIKLRTRLGRAASSTGGKASKIKQLSESYKKERKRLKKKGTLSSDTTASKSNLTKTGEMIDSIDYSASDKITIQVTGEENIRKAKENAEQGRSFMYLSNLDIKSIRDLISQTISKYLK